jgi:hypothetical protein
MNDEYRSLESQFFPFVFVSLLAKQVPWTLDTCTQRKWQQQTENTPKIILNPPRQRKRTPNTVESPYPTLAYIRDKTNFQHEQKEERQKYKTQLGLFMVWLKKKSEPNQTILQFGKTEPLIVRPEPMLQFGESVLHFPELFLF